MAVKRPINYDLLYKNVDEMIGLLEFDAMRSAGKTKMNAQHLAALYELQDRYTKKLSKPAVKAPAKKEV